jgi:hypothetical protein
MVLFQLVLHQAKYPQLPSRVALSLRTKCYCVIRKGYSQSLNTKPTNIRL